MQWIMVRILVFVDDAQVENIGTGLMRLSLTIDFVQDVREKNERIDVPN